MYLHCETVPAHEFIHFTKIRRNIILTLQPSSFHNTTLPCAVCTVHEACNLTCPYLVQPVSNSHLFVFGPVSIKLSPVRFWSSRSQTPTVRFWSSQSQTLTCPFLVQSVANPHLSVFWFRQSQTLTCPFFGPASIRLSPVRFWSSQYQTLTVRFWPSQFQTLTCPFFWSSQSQTLTCPFCVQTTSGAGLPDL